MYAQSTGMYERKLYRVYGYNCKNEKYKKHISSPKIVSMLKALKHEKGGDKNKQKWIVKITLNCTVVKKRIRCVQNLYLKLKHGFCIQKRLYMHITDFHTVVNTC